MNQGKKRLVATIGVEGLVIVCMDDVVLVLSKEYKQDVRTIVQRLEQKEWDDWL